MNSESSAVEQAFDDAAQVASAHGMPAKIQLKVLHVLIIACTSEFSVPFAAVANCPAAKPCSSIAAFGAFALAALRAWDWAW